MYIHYSRPLQKRREERERGREWNGGRGRKSVRKEGEEAQERGNIMNIKRTRKIERDQGKQEKKKQERIEKR